MILPVNTAPVDALLAGIPLVGRLRGIHLSVFSSSNHSTIRTLGHTGLLSVVKLKCQPSSIGQQLRGQPLRLLGEMSKGQQHNRWSEGSGGSLCEALDK